MNASLARDTSDIAMVFRHFKPRLIPDIWQTEVMAWWPTSTENLAYVAPRRVGKDATACAIAAFSMAFRPGFEVFVAGPTEVHGTEDVRAVRNYLLCFPDQLRPRFRFDTKTGLELVNGSRMKAGTANPSSCRGVGADMVILTEACYLGDDMIAAVLPTVIQKRGRLLACSTPSLGDSWFRRIFDEPDRTGKGWRTRRITPADVPRFTDREREAAKGSLTEEAFQREMEGLWSDGDDHTEVALDRFPLVSSPVAAARLVAEDWSAILAKRGLR